MSKPKSFHRYYSQAILISCAHVVSLMGVGDLYWITPFFPVPVETFKISLSDFKGLIQLLVRSEG
jgi:hypothetical protein